VVADLPCKVYAKVKPLTPVTVSKTDGIENAGVAEREGKIKPAVHY